DLVRLADAARRQHHGLGLEEYKAAAFTVVAKSAADAVAVLEQLDDGAFHVHGHPLMNAVVLQCADHFQTAAVADIGQARILVTAEVALENTAVLGAVEDCPPR